MKVGVVVFPGSNCDRDMEYALEQLLGCEIKMIWHNENHLFNVDALVLPGGFSFGDYLRSGAIARYSPVMSRVCEFADKGGPVLGICNGFQVLCEAGLLPGALLRNSSILFKCDNVFITPESGNRLGLSKAEKSVYKIPIAHGEGRYFCDNETLESLNHHSQIVFRYCDKNGKVDEASNPNGSMQNIAGICNRKGNVFGMMPHPERATGPDLHNRDGESILMAWAHLMATV